MIVGIRLVGMITDLIATYFITEDETDDTKEYIKTEVCKFGNLSDKEIYRLVTLINTYKN